MTFSGLILLNSSRCHAFILMLVGVCLLNVGCEKSASTKQEGKDDYHKRIHFREEESVQLFRLPHKGGSGFSAVLIIDNHEFRDCRGFSPYYLDLPEQKRVVFATGKYGGINALIHVYDFNEGRHFEFQTKYNGGSFGSGICRDEKGERDYVESTSKDKIVLVNESLGVRTSRKIVLDLKEERIDYVEWFVYDRDGKLTNNYVVRY